MDSTHQQRPNATMALLKWDHFITFQPRVDPVPANLVRFRWRMHFSLPYPFPTKTCVKETVSILDNPFSVGIYNHYNRVIKTIRAGQSGPPICAVMLEDKRKQVETYPDCVSFARQALQSVVIFDDLTDYPTPDAAFARAAKKIDHCCQWLSGFLSACQRAAPYLAAWLVYPVSLFDVGTVYHEVAGFCSSHQLWHHLVTGVAISLGRHLQNPAFVMDMPQGIETASPLDTANELLAEALMSLFRGMSRLTVLNAYTAVESFANAVFTTKKVSMLLSNNVPIEMAEKLVEEERERHKTEPNFLFHRGIKEAAGRSLMEENKEQYDALLAMQKLRHRVAHSGYKPTRDEARKAHTICCEGVRWFTELSGLPVKAMLPDSDTTFPNVTFAGNDAHARNPLELEFVRQLLNATVSSAAIPNEE